VNIRCTELAEYSLLSVVSDKAIKPEIKKMIPEIIGKAMLQEDIIENKRKKTNTKNNTEVIIKIVFLSFIFSSFLYCRFFFKTIVTKIDFSFSNR